MSKQKTVEDYRRDIQLMKHKLSKIQAVNDELQQRMKVNVNSDILYVKPVSTVKRIKNDQFYYNEFFRLTWYRGLTLEALFRCIQCNNTVEIVVFQQFLTQFLDPSQNLTQDSQNEMNREVQTMVAHLGSAMDINFTGFIDRNTYIGLLQIYGVESESVEIISKNITLKGVTSQPYQNVYEQSLDIFINILKDERNSEKFLQCFTNNTCTLEEFQTICSQSLDIDSLVSGAFFNYIDRYGKQNITKKQFEDTLIQIVSAQFNLKGSTQYLNLNCLVSMDQEMKEFRAIISRMKSSPVDIFLKGDPQQSGRVSLRELLRIIENEINFSFNKNKILYWLRFIDMSKTGYIDCFQFVYSLLSTEDVAEFTASIQQRAKLIKSKSIVNELEVLSQLAFRMKAFDMKPGHWFAMIQKSKDQQSVDVCQVKDSLFKLGFDISSTVDLLRVLDTNSNFFVEYGEIQQLFGSKLKLKESEDLQVSIRRFVDFLVEKFGSIDKGADKVFSKFDTDGSGILSREEFLYALDQIDDVVQLSEDQKAVILDMADKNRDNQITIAEFKQWLNESYDFGLPQSKVAQQTKPQQQPQPQQQPNLQAVQAVQAQAQAQTKAEEQAQTQAQAQVQVQQGLIQAQANKIQPSSKIQAAKNYKPKAGILLMSRISETQINAFDLYKVIEQLEQSGKKYEDLVFPTMFKSLGQKPDKQNLVWKRPKDFLDSNETLKLYKGTIEPNDIKQGELGDCYFLSSLSVLAERPNLIQRLIESTEINEQGMYGVWLCINGQWQCFYLDDQFPCKKRADMYSTAFSTAHDAELWVLLMEKAYAKAFGSYEKIENGMTGMAIRDLSGAPYFFQTVKDPDTVWTFLITQKQFVLTAGSQVEDHQKQTGIVSSHAYAILDVQSIVLKNGSFKLIKLRNPWGQGEWSGRWSDESKEWTDEAKSKLAYQKANDGVFWMQIDDFVTAFAEICASKLYEDYIYASVAATCLAKNQKNPNIWRGYVKLQTNSPDCRGYITISQIDQRSYLPSQEYKYSVVRCILWKGQVEQSVQIVTDAFGCERDLCFEVNLKDKEEYGLYFEVDWCANKISDFPFQLVISSYTSTEITSCEPQEVVNTSDQELMITRLLMGVSSTKFKVTKYSEQNLIVKLVGQACGYILFKYSNNSDHSTLEENLILKDVKNLTEMNLNTIQKDYKVLVAPKNIFNVYFRISAKDQGAFSYSSESSYRITDLVPLPQTQPQLQPQTQQQTKSKLPAQTQKQPADQKINKPAPNFKPKAGIIQVIKITETQINAFDLYKVIEQLELSGKKYDDLVFPTMIRSLGQKPDKQNLVWKRPKDFLDSNETLQLYKGAIEPNDIKQGELGDCYFLSSLSVLAERPNLIQRLIESTEINEQGMYGVWLCINGQWQCFYLDDQFPCQLQVDRYVTAFSRANDAELWVLLMEKAYAKAFGSYEKIESGITGMAIRDLSGAPYFSQTVKDPDTVWSFLIEQKQFVLTAGSQAENHQKQTGIVSGHAYAILDVQSIVLKNGSFKLIKLRNPWGQGEWSGRWSDESKEWTDEAKSKLDYQKSNDGVFWMQIEDFVTTFAEVYANKVHQDYTYASVTANCVAKNQTKPNIWRGYVKLQPTQSECHGYITISQIDQRSYLPSQGYNYSVVRCIFWRGQVEQSVQIVTDAFGCERDLCFEVNLKDKEEYGLYFEVDWCANKISDFPFQLVISSYTSTEITSCEPQEVVNTSDQELMITRLLMGVSSSNMLGTNYPESPLILKEKGKACGYIFFKYTNNSDSSTLNETFMLTDVQNLTQMNLQTIQKEYKVAIAPKSTFALYFRISAEDQGAFSYGSSSSYNVTNSYTDQQLIDMAQAKPASTNQREGKNGPLDVYVYCYFYDDGLALVFMNKSKMDYKEKLTLDLTNLKAQSKEYIIELKSMQSFLIRATIIDQDQEISCGSDDYVVLSK